MNKHDSPVTDAAQKRFIFKAMKCLAFVLFLSAIVPSCCLAQSKNAQKDNITEIIDDSKISPTNLEKAKFQIYDIKNRGVIVRLKTDRDKIKAMKAAGYGNIAEKYQQKVNATNAKLVNSFIRIWSFCPFYFMESQNTQSLILHDSLIAKSFNLAYDTVIHVDRDSFYIIDVGPLLVNAPSDQYGKRSAETGNEASGDFLLVMDSKQKQLQYPVPYKKKVWHIEWSLDKLNKQFIDYYCGRLEDDYHRKLTKDENYWWSRNPNKQYQQALPALEEKLGVKPKVVEPKFIKQD